MYYLLFPLLFLVGCGPVPVQIRKQSNEQSQSADQQSAHQSESKQGTNSMPVIVICNQNNSRGASCAAPREGAPLESAVTNRLKGASQ